MRGPDSNTGSGLLDRLSPICHRDAPPLSGPHRPSAAREMAPDCRVRNDCYCLASRRLFGHCCRVSTPSPPVPPAPDGEDLRGLARGMRHLLELAAQTLSAEAGPSGLALRVTGHLGCELTEVVLVSARFPIWEHVNVQRGVDARSRRTPRARNGSARLGAVTARTRTCCRCSACLRTPRWGGPGRGARPVPWSAAARAGAAMRRSAPPATAPPRPGPRRTLRWYRSAW